jgi:cytosine/adenosine deaminase-related metal-dependent hydrolase
VRAVELDERLRSGRRGHWSAAELLQAATADGHAVLGWPEAGRLVEGAVADFVCVALGSVRLAGARAETLLESSVFAAGAADVSDVVVAGRQVVAGGDHLLLSDVAAALDSAIEAVRP